jgi:hypothetical protein
MQLRKRTEPRHILCRLKICRGAVRLSDFTFNDKNKSYFHLNYQPIEMILPQLKPIPIQIRRKNISKLIEILFRKHNGFYFFFAV